jgi:uncharacterized protein (DUF362 family)
VIVLTYGDEIVKNTYDTLKESDISAYLKADYNVALKPNLVVEGPASLGATTHPEVVEGIILYLKDFGVGNIKIIESSWIGSSTKQAFKDCGYLSLSKKYNIPLIDLKNDRYTTLRYKDFKIDICNEALETDFLINVPVLKAHCQTRLTCCLKNLKGCIPDSEKRRFHTIGLHRPIAALNALIKPGYNVVDGICGDLTFEEGGNPVISNRIIAGRDPVMLDSFCASLIGYRPEEILHLLYAKEYGLGEFYSKSTEIKELNTDQKPLVSAKSGRAAERYEKMIVEDSACSACYSALIYALNRSGGRINSNQKIYIGQGFKGKTGKGQGVGKCAEGFGNYIPGCPPKAVDIVESLR